MTLYRFKLGKGVYGETGINSVTSDDLLLINKTTTKVTSILSAPISSTGLGEKGEIRSTEDHIYVCVATNTWKRSPLETW